MGQDNTKRILIVDDDADIRHLLSIKLKKHGYEIIEAADGEEGLEKLKSDSPDMVMVDVRMPGIDGFEFCEQASQLSSLKYIPIMIMTATDDHDSVNRAYEKGATDFITKPINHAKLVHRLRFALRASETAERLAQRERQLLSAQQTAKMGEWTHDIKNNVFHCSDEAAKIFGLKSGGDVTYDTLLKYVVDDHLDRVRDVINNPSLKDKGYSLEYSIKTDAGEVKRIRQIIDVDTDEAAHDGKLIGVFQDITELRNAEQQIKTLSFYDGLTGLPNRRFFKRLLQKAIDSGRRQHNRFAVLDINFDNFMRINANLGHDVGDKLLNEASQRLNNVVRSSDNEEQESLINSGLLAHLGGDNFIVMLKDLKNADDAALLARRINEVFNENFQVLGNEIHISTSIGISIFPDDGEDGEGLLKKASSALNHAKETGRDCYRFYTESMNEESSRRLSLEIGLRKALEKEQFQLYYQPKVSLIDNHITGAEALIRWNHPEMGMVSPAQFIPVAENTGLEVPMTDWVITEACRQVGEWRAQGFMLESVAINMPPTSLLNKNINEHIFKNLKMAGVDASRLDFEITESVFMEDVDIILPILKEFRSVGSTISIDDFGTGYSSLSYLKRLPLSKLKIDQSFIRDLLQSKDSAIIVKAVIALAHSLDLKVIAEGVEKIEQLEYLREYGCDVVQGYYYSRPLPADEFYQWCQEHENKIEETDSINVLNRRVN